MRYPEKALKYGINFLSECFTDLPTDVFKTVHACCGYPTYLVKPYFYFIIFDAQSDPRIFGVPNTFCTVKQSVFLNTAELLQDFYIT